jgi:hypothetical protein
MPGPPIPWILRIPKYTFSPFLLAPTYSIITRTSPLETGILLFKATIPICIGGALFMETTNGLNKNNYDSMSGSKFMVMGMVACVSGWFALGQLALIKYVIPKILDY